MRRVSASGGAFVGACHRRDGGSASGASGGVSCGCAIRRVLNRDSTVIALEILLGCSCGAALLRVLVLKVDVESREKFTCHSGRFPRRRP